MQNIRVFLITSLALILFNSALALDCQYTQLENYKELKQGIYNQSGEYFGKPLILKDFVSYYYGFGGCSGNPSFKIYNQYPFEISINLSSILFKSSPSSAYPEARQEIFAELTLPPYGEKNVERPCIGVGTNYFLNDSVSYIFISPADLILKTEYQNNERIVCKTCDGSMCFNDGLNCTLDEQCGSGICNFTGYCAKERNCPLGTRECEGKCLVPGQRGYNEQYSCKWECQSESGSKGICKKKDGDPCIIPSECGSNICNSQMKTCGVFKNCTNGMRLCNGACKSVFSLESGVPFSCSWECKYNQSDKGICCAQPGSNLGNSSFICKEECLYGNNGEGLCCAEPSSRVAGESYTCGSECRSGRYKNGSCLRSNEWWIGFIVLCILLASGSIWYFAYHKRRKEESNLEELKKNIEELEGKRNELDNSIKKSNEEISKLEAEKDKGNKEIVALKEKIKNSKGEAKQKFEEELSRQHDENKEIEDNIITERNKLRKQKEELDSMKSKLDSEKKTVEETTYELHVKQQLEKYRKKYNSSGKRIEYNGSYFIVKYNDGNIEFLHRWIYSKKYRDTQFELKSGEEVHHIDNDSINNEEWNLVALPHHLHDKNSSHPGKLIHGKIWKKDFVLGYEELKKQLGMKDEDFPECVREHYKEELKRSKSSSEASNS